VIVRYHIPDEVDFTIEHLVGNASHLTLTMNRLTDLASYLDNGWWEVQDF